MLSLYPEIKPNAQHRIAVDPPHELYVEESGNPDGMPVLVVHGGPGVGARTITGGFSMPSGSGLFLWISAVPSVPRR